MAGTFNRTVVLLCRHRLDQGSYGLIVNRTMQVLQNDANINSRFMSRLDGPCPMRWKLEKQHLVKLVN